MGGAGFIVLLLGIFTRAYDFITGLIVAIGIWIFSGFLAKYLDIDRKHHPRKHLAKASSPKPRIVVKRKKRRKGK